MRFFLKEGKERLNKQIACLPDGVKSARKKPTNEKALKSVGKSISDSIVQKQYPEETSHNNEAELLVLLLCFFHLQIN